MTSRSHNEDKTKKNVASGYNEPPSPSSRRSGGAFSSRALDRSHYTPIVRASIEKRRTGAGAGATAGAVTTNNTPAIQSIVQEPQSPPPMSLHNSSASTATSSAATRTPPTTKPISSFSSSTASSTAAAGTPPTKPISSSSSSAASAASQHDALTARSSRRATNKPLLVEPHTPQPTVDVATTDSLANMLAALNVPDPSSDSPPTSSNATITSPTIAILPPSSQPSTTPLTATSTNTTTTITTSTSTVSIGPEVVSSGSKTTTSSSTTAKPALKISYTSSAATAATARRLSENTNNSNTINTAPSPRASSSSAIEFTPVQIVEPAHPQLQIQLSPPIQQSQQQQQPTYLPQSSSSVSPPNNASSSSSTGKKLNKPSPNASNIPPTIPAAPALSQQNLDELKQAFSVFDTAGRGSITTAQFAVAFKMLDSQVSDAELNAMITELDANGDGDITFDEFASMMGKRGNNVSAAPPSASSSHQLPHRLSQESNGSSSSSSSSSSHPTPRHAHSVVRTRHVPSQGFLFESQLDGRSDTFGATHAKGKNSAFTKAAAARQYAHTRAAIQHQQSKKHTTHGSSSSGASDSHPRPSLAIQPSSAIASNNNNDSISIPVAVERPLFLPSAAPITTDTTAAPSTTTTTTSSSATIVTFMPTSVDSDEESETEDELQLRHAARMNAAAAARRSGEAFKRASGNNPFERRNSQSTANLFSQNKRGTGESTTNSPLKPSLEQQLSLGGGVQKHKRMTSNVTIGDILKGVQPTISPAVSLSTRPSLNLRSSRNLGLVGQADSNAVAAAAGKGPEFQSATEAAIAAAAKLEKDLEKGLSDDSSEDEGEEETTDAQTFTVDGRPRSRLPLPILRLWLVLKWLRQCTNGTMPKWNEFMCRNPWTAFIESYLRGWGQVCFQNNPLTGAAIIVAMFLNDTWIALMGVYACLVSTGLAKLLGLNPGAYAAGLFGYNAVLVGLGMATFDVASMGRWNYAIMGPIFLMSVFSDLVLIALSNVLVGKFNVPPLTLSFNFSASIYLMGAVVMNYFPVPFHSGSSGPSFVHPIASDPYPIDWLEFIKAIPIGIGQVFLASELSSGLVILGGLAICSPISAFFAALGSLVGNLTALGIGIDPSSIYFGLWGYNSVLGAIALGGFFYLPNATSTMMSILCAIICAMVQATFKVLFSALGGFPSLTFPFCLVTLVFLLLQNSIPDLLVPIPLMILTYPEEHKKRYRIHKTFLSEIRRTHELISVLEWEAKEAERVKEKESKEAAMALLLKPAALIAKALSIARGQKLGAHTQHVHKSKAVLAKEEEEKQKREKLLAESKAQLKPKQIAERSEKISQLLDSFFDLLDPDGSTDALTLHQIRASLNNVLGTINSTSMLSIEELAKMMLFLEEEEQVPEGEEEDPDRDPNADPDHKPDSDLTLLLSLDPDDIFLEYDELFEFLMNYKRIDWKAQFLQVEGEGEEFDRESGSDSDSEHGQDTQQMISVKDLRPPSMSLSIPMPPISPRNNNMNNMNGETNEISGTIADLSNDRAEKRASLEAIQKKRQSLQIQQSLPIVPEHH